MRVELAAMMTKEFRQTFRDKRMALILVVAPVMQLTLLGYAVDLEVDRVPTIIVDHDQTSTSRRFLRELLADGTLRRVAADDTGGVIVELGDAEVAIVLPRGLERDVMRERPARVQVLVDGTDPMRGRVADVTATQYFERENVRLAVESLGRMTGAEPDLSGIAIVPRVAYNPRLRSPVYMVPGVAAIVLLIVTTVVTSMGIARERELGTIEQLIVTPMQPIVLLLGKVLPFALFGLVAATLVISIGTVVFSVPMRGSLFVIFVGTLLYLLSTLGVGVFISTVSRNQQQAILGGFFFLLPAILISGFMSPIANMPAWLRALSWIDPARHFIEILRACLLKGAGFEDLWVQMLALFSIGTVILGASALRFRKQIA